MGGSAFAHQDSLKWLVTTHLFSEGSLHEEAGNVLSVPMPASDYTH